MHFKNVGKEKQASLGSTLVSLSQLPISFFLWLNNISLFYFILLFLLLFKYNCLYFHPTTYPALPSPPSTLKPTLFGFVMCPLYMFLVKQWNRIKSPEINLSLYGQLIFDKGSRSIQWSKNSLFDKRCWEIWTATCKKMKLDNHSRPTITIHKNNLIPYTKINSKWIKDLNKSHDTINVLEENIGRKISDILRSNIFSDMSLRSRDIKERVNK